MRADGSFRTLGNIFHGDDEDSELPEKDDAAVRSVSRSGIHIAAAIKVFQMMHKKWKCKDQEYKDRKYIGWKHIKCLRSCNDQGLSGVITVELSYLIPIIFVIFLMVIYTTFYYHDKNILIGAASETAVVGAQMERKPGEGGQTDLAAFYQERIQGKLILFSGAEASVNTSKKWVEVSAYADSGGMQLHVVQRAAMQKPEAAIRRKWMLEKAVQSIKKEKGESEEDSVKVEDAKSGQSMIGQTGGGKKQIGQTGNGQN